MQKLADLFNLFTYRVVLALLMCVLFVVSFVLGAVVLFPLLLIAILLFAKPPKK